MCACVFVCCVYVWVCFGCVCLSAFYVRFVCLSFFDMCVNIFVWVYYLCSICVCWTECMLMFVLYVCVLYIFYMCLFLDMGVDRVGVFYEYMCFP